MKKCVLLFIFWLHNISLVGQTIEIRPESIILSSFSSFIGRTDFRIGPYGYIIAEIKGVKFEDDSITNAKEIVELVMHVSPRYYSNTVKSLNPDFYFIIEDTPVFFVFWNRAGTGEIY